MTSPRISDDPTRWTVHVLGPDDVHYFDTAERALSFAGGAVSLLALLYPRRSKYDPVIRVVISPPTSVLKDYDREATTR